MLTSIQLTNAQILESFFRELGEEILRTYEHPTSYDTMYTAAPLQDLPQVRDNTIFGDSERDADLPMDTILGDASVKCCAKYDWIKTITIEGRDSITLHEDGIINIYVDPLDGSLNYAKDPNGFLFQHGYCATLVTEKQSPEFRDIIGAIGINLSQRISSYSVLKEGGLESFDTMTIEPKPKTPLALRNDLQFNPGQNLHIWEAYYPEMREFLDWASVNGHISKGWLRSPGSAVIEMMATAFGISSSFVCCMQKCHESGMGYFLTLANGGVAKNLETGKNLSDCLFDFDAKIPMVLAANQDIANRWVEIYQEYLKSQECSS